MKKLSAILFMLLLIQSCRNKSTTPHTLPDGFYEVTQADSVIETSSVANGNLLIGFDTLFNPGDYSLVIIDTTDFVPLELETDPYVQSQDDHKKLLSVTLTRTAAEKMKKFSLRLVGRHVAIVLDGKALTMHRIKEPITSGSIQISRCNDNACEYIFTKIQEKRR